MSDSTCLYTTVKNTSGVAAFFGFIGRHGKSLAVNGETTVPGSLVDFVKDHPTKLASLNAALLGGKLTIISGPSVILENSDGDGQILSLDGDDEVAVGDPCWA